MFAATHEVLLGLVAEGLIDGLRIDHPDGLADPRGYLRQLATAPAAAGSWPRRSWPAARNCPPTGRAPGTTGYDALAAVGGLFTDPAGDAPLAAEYARLTAGPGEFAPVAEAAKREEAGQPLAAEVSRLARLAARDGASGAGQASAPATCPPCWPSCSPRCRCTGPTWCPASSRRRSRPRPLAGAAAAARARLPERLHPALDAWSRPWCSAAAPPAAAHARADRHVPAGLRAGPGQGRRGHRVLPLVAAGRAERGRRRPGRRSGPARRSSTSSPRGWPGTGRPRMTTLSTHDTKRQEDVRARLAVLAESRRPGPPR